MQDKHLWVFMPRLLSERNKMVNMPPEFNTSNKLLKAISFFIDGILSNNVVNQKFMMKSAYQVLFLKTQF